MTTPAQDGTPIRFLDLAAATAELRPQLDAAWQRVVDGGQYVLGEEVERFERAFAAVAGCDAAVGVGNGLEALQIALEAAGVGHGDEVIVPAHTFIATWLAVSNLGAIPVPAEPAADRYNVSASTIEPLITRRTRAIVAVHLYGEPVEMEPLQALAATHGLPLIEDAAQAHGALRHGRHVGSLATAAAFSFYPGKNLGAFGDGGAISSCDADLLQRARALRNYGGAQKYQHDLRGRNSRLDSLQAAILSVKLTRLDAWNAHRRRVAAFYQQALSGIADLTLPSSLPGNEPVWHLYVLRCPHRDALQDWLSRQGIETAIHYPQAVYRTPAFASLAPPAQTLSDRLASEVLSLPMGPHLSLAQAARVAQVVIDFFAASK